MLLLLFVLLAHHEFVMMMIVVVPLHREPPPSYHQRIFVYVVDSLLVVGLFLFLFSPLPSLMLMTMLPFRGNPRLSIVPCVLQHREVFDLDDHMHSTHYD